MTLYILVCLNFWPIGNGTISGCGLVGAGVVLLEEVCHCGGGLCGPLPSCLEDSSFLLAFGTQCRPLQHHAYLDAAMLPALTEPLNP